MGNITGSAKGHARYKTFQMRIISLSLNNDPDILMPDMGIAFPFFTRFSSLLLPMQTRTESPTLNAQV